MWASFATLLVDIQIVFATSYGRAVTNIWTALSLNEPFCPTDNEKKDDDDDMIVVIKEEDDEKEISSKVFAVNIISEILPSSDFA